MSIYIDYDLKQIYSIFEYENEYASIHHYCVSYTVLL